MNCLNCDVEMSTHLVHTDHGHIDYDMCDACGGLWLDRRELDQLAFQVEALVAENVKLWEPVTRDGLRAGRDEWGREVNELAASCGLEIDPSARVGELPYSMQQRVAILRALAMGSDFLILDEPTTNLTPDQVAELFELLYALVGAGGGVLLITHKIGEVLEATSRLSVLRNGEVAARFETKDTDQQEVAEAMIGAPTVNPPKRGRAKVGTERLLELRSLVLRTDAAQGPLIDLEVHRGEILGIAGVAGNGQTELAETISGTRQPESGEILLDGGPLAGLGAEEVAGLGVGYVPADRNETATTPGLTVAEALAMKTLRTPGVCRHGLLRRGAIEERAREAVAAFDIRPPDPQIRCGQLSEGNLQKVVLARELTVARRMLVAVQPTQGLDIAARDFVRERLRVRVADGMSLVLISTELDEVLALSHRIAVIYRFGLIGILDAKEVSNEHIGRLMGGVSDD